LRVLVTGGTGVIGRPVVDRLVLGGHTVRLLTRHARRDCGLWPGRVEAHEGSVGTDREVTGAAEQCDAVLHIAGIVAEKPPELTFDNINVEGTRRIVREAERAGVRRLVHLSSLGADRGRSDYHRSKLESEAAASAFDGEWVICRPGNVYGPGDDVVSLLLKWVRSMPAVPVVSGDHPFQPIAADDLAEALVKALEGEGPAHEVFELAGLERVTMPELLDLLEEITDRHPSRIPVPEWAAVAGTGLAKLIGVEVPVSLDQVTMLLEDNIIPEDGRNALTEVFGVEPRPLAKGLAELADSLPAHLPGEGVGPMQHQRYWTEIHGGSRSADELFELLQRDFSSLLPRDLLEVGAEPGSARSIEEGATLTMAIPMRGNIQVRVLEVGRRTISCVTVEGHLLAGLIRFLIHDHDDGRIHFEVRSYSRASQLLDELGMAALGQRAQHRTWSSVVERIAEQCGVNGSQVHTHSARMTEFRAEIVERWVEQLVMARRREAVARGVTGSP
jgi:nucleoside-diphosphate-sugar epimerase